MIHRGRKSLLLEAFLRAFKNLKTFRGDAKFSSWLYRIAVNAALAERSKKRVEHVSLDSLEHLPADQSSQPDFVYQGLFCGKVVDEALRQLPPHYAMALRLFYLKGVGYVEIAELMTIPIGTVKTYLAPWQTCPARNHFRQVLSGGTDMIPCQDVRWRMKAFLDGSLDRLPRAI